MIVITFLIGVKDFPYDLANLSLLWHSRNTEVGLQPYIDISDPFEPEHSISIGVYRFAGKGLVFFTCWTFPKEGQIKGVTGSIYISL